MTDEQFKQRAIILMSFLKYYIALEDKVKQIFISKISTFDHNTVHELYFYHGALVGYPTIDGKNKSADWIQPKFTLPDECKFDKFNFKKIISIERIVNSIEVFNSTIQSLQVKRQLEPLIKCCSCFINMRNKIAHVSDEDNQFNDTKFYIDILSHDVINKYITKHSMTWLENSTQGEHQDNLIILSNIVYINEVLSKLSDVSPQ